MTTWLSGPVAPKPLPTATVTGERIPPGVEVTDKELDEQEAGLRGSPLEDPPARSQILIDEIQMLGVKVSGTGWQQRKAKAVAYYSSNSAENISELSTESLELMLAALQHEARKLNSTTGK